MLVAPRTFLGIATQPVRQGLASSASAEAQSLGKTVIETHGYIHGHVDIVIRCGRC